MKEQISYCFLIILVGLVFGSSHSCLIDDDDNDRISDEVDNCQNITNPDQQDTDMDAIGDECDNCPLSANLEQFDFENDQVGDECDNCPAVINPGQEDSDNDEMGDGCDFLTTIEVRASKDSPNGIGNIGAKEELMRFTGSNVGKSTAWLLAYKFRIDGDFTPSKESVTITKTNNSLSYTTVKYSIREYFNPNELTNEVVLKASSIGNVFFPIGSSLKITTDGVLDGIFQLVAFWRDDQYYHLSLDRERTILGTVGGENDYVEYFPLLPSNGYLCLGAFSHLSASYQVGDAFIQVEDTICFSPNSIIYVWGYTPLGERTNFQMKVVGADGGRLEVEEDPDNPAANIKYDFKPDNLAAVTTAGVFWTAIPPSCSIDYSIWGGTTAAKSGDYLRLSLFQIAWNDDELFLIDEGTAYLPTQENKIEFEVE